MIASTAAKKKTKAKPDGAEELWIQFKNDPENIDLRNQLVDFYFHIVKYNAERMKRRLPDSVEVDDLVSDGTFGLIDAIKAFDIDRGIKFSTYSVPRIRGAILDGLRGMDWVPRLVRSRENTLENGRKEYWKSNGRLPSDDELAESMDMTSGELNAFLTEVVRPELGSLDKVHCETDSFRSRTIADMVKVQCPPSERIERVQSTAKLLKGFSKVERIIILFYYFENMTMKQIAETLGRSESRVSQMHSRLIERLRQSNDVADLVA